MVVPAETIKMLIEVIRGSDCNICQSDCIAFGLDDSSIRNRTEVNNGRDSDCNTKAVSLNCFSAFIINKAIAERRVII